MTASNRERTPRISAIVLGAGTSSRYGAPKLLERLNSKPLLQWVLDAALGSTAQETILVLGDHWDAVLRRIDTGNAKVVLNPKFERGMSSSIRAGLKVVSADSAACIFMMGDQPFADSSLVDGLISAFGSHDCVAVVPVYGDVSATPTLISRELFPEVMRLRGDVGAKSVITRHNSSVFRFQVSERFRLHDVDTPRDLALLRSILRNNSGLRHK